MLLGNCLKEELLKYLDLLVSSRYNQSKFCHINCSFVLSVGNLQINDKRRSTAATEIKTGSEYVEYVGQY